VSGMQLQLATSYDSALLDFDTSDDHIMLSHSLMMSHRLVQVLLKANAEVIPVLGQPVAMHSMAAAMIW